MTKLPKPHGNQQVYIAGPMSAYKDHPVPEHRWNRSSFAEATKRWRAAGWTVYSPVEFDDNIYGGPDKAHTMASESTLLLRDLAIIEKCDAVAVLPDWDTKSRGARLEIHFANFSQKRVYDANTGQSLWVIRSTGSLPEELGGPPTSFEVPEDRLEGFESAWAEKAAKQTVDFHRRCAEAEEQRVVSPTGGAKGQKLERYDLIPPGPLSLLAAHYGKGARKYGDDNWRKGYPWSLNFAAMQRHAWAFWRGEDDDPETGTPHLVAVAWHAFTLLEFAKIHPAYDDRSKG